MWDIRYYFARRGGENIDKMTKDTFKLSTDPTTGVKFIEKVMDEETKNHKEVDGQLVTGYMTELPNDHKLWPLQSYLTYLYSLSPDSNELWQSPKFTNFPEDPRIRTFYGPSNVGHNSHEKFVGKIAKNCGLDEFKYTNHSLRVTAITTLTRQNYTNKQIMSITGHKSSASLETYQRVSPTEKIQMGCSLGDSLLHSSALVPYHPPQQPAKNPIPNIANQAPLPLEANIEEENPVFDGGMNMTDQELMNIIQQAERDNHDILLSQSKEMKTKDGTKMVSTNTIKKSSPQIPVFTGCTFNGNVTININK